MVLTASTEPDVPDAPCGIYCNPDDERVCVCARDPFQCGKRVPAANLATCRGKLICFIYVSVIVAAAVLGILFRFIGARDDGKDEQDYCDPDCDAACADMYGCVLRVE